MSVTKEQIYAAWAEAQRRLLPSVIANVQSNSDQIAVYLKRNQLEFTPENLLDAIAALDIKQLIIWEVEPVVVAAPRKSAEQIDAEFRAKEIKRVKAEEAENRVSFSERTKKAEEERKHAELTAKAFESARVQANNLICQWDVNKGPGRIDHAKTEAGQAELRKIKINRGGKPDPTATLAVIQKVYHLESAEAIRAAIPKAIQQLNSKESDVTIVGNLPRYS